MTEGTRKCRVATSGHPKNQFHDLFAKYSIKAVVWDHQCEIQIAISFDSLNNWKQAKTLSGTRILMKQKHNATAPKQI